MSDKLLKEAFDKLTAIEEATGDDIHTQAIDLLDDMLASSGDDYYSEKGEILRYAIRRLQEVGAGRD